MRNSAYRIAKAFCNLASRGQPPENALQCARRWADEQSKLGLTRVTRADANALVDIQCPIEPGRLYLAARYGCYPQIFKVLAHQSPRNTVYCLAGDLDPKIRKIAGMMARVARCRAEFVSISAATIRLLRQKLSDGHNVVMMIDGPFPAGSKTHDVAITTALGEYRSNLAISRLPSLLDPQFKAIYCERREGRDTICALGETGFPAIVRALASRVRENPAQYEPLPDLHKQWICEGNADIAVVFDHNGGKLLLHARNMRAWKIPNRYIDRTAAGARCSPAMRNSLADKLGVKIDDLYTL